MRVRAGTLIDDLLVVLIAHIALSPRHPFGVAMVTAGAYLAAGSETGAQVSASDRSLKETFAPVNGGEVLAQLAEVPINTWNYKAGPARVT